MLLLLRANDTQGRQDVLEAVGAFQLQKTTRNGSKGVTFSVIIATKCIHSDNSIAGQACTVVVADGE